MVVSFISALAISISISLFLTPILIKVAHKLKLFDNPDHRKQHERALPRIGGISITVAFLTTFLLYFDLNRQFIGLFSGILILFIVGLIDDVRGVSAWKKLIWQVVASGAVLAGGIGIVYISDPFGGTIILDSFRIPIELFGFNFNIIPLANAVSILWMIVMINSINFLDGLDGLASGVSIIAAGLIFLLALTPAIGNIEVAMLAVVLGGSLLGFLPYNFYPSRIFMGDSGAYVIGLILALLSIYSGSKIALGALVMGLAMIDAFITVSRRLLRKQSPFRPDRNHLHHRLLDSGLLSHRQVVLILYLLTIIVAITIIVAGGLAAFSVIITALILAGIILRISAIKIRKI
jgi:UDP-GlcNAc:undecaprenyl-phosphate/decaprenyl-phosphate GlcNAc-1-phosphate transferase